MPPASLAEGIDVYDGDWKNYGAIQSSRRTIPSIPKQIPVRATTARSK